MSIYGEKQDKIWQKYENQFSMEDCAIGALCKNYLLSSLNNHNKITTENLLNQTDEKKNEDREI